MIQLNSAVSFSENSSKLCSKIHVYRVKRFRQADFEQENSAVQFRKNSEKLLLR